MGKKEMKIQNREIELVFAKEEEPNYIYHVRTVKFVKTPKGRRKLLAEVLEEFDPNTKKIKSISFDMSNTKTTRERLKLLAYLTQNAIDTKSYFHSKTVKVMQLPFFADVSLFSIRF